ATVTVANNGREALDLLSNGPQPPPFDVVLMDLQMPVMDGYQATAKLRSDARFAALPIIAMTAHATIEEKQRCLAAGMNDHISKPIDPSAMFETVARYYRSAAERTAHTVKGVAGNLGVKTVQLAAGELEEAIHDGADAARLESLRRQFATLLTPFVARLRAALGEEPESPPAPKTMAVNP